MSAPASLADGPVLTDAGELPHLLVDEPLADPADPASRLPLRATRATIHVQPPFAEVEVVQRFENPRKGPIEVVYVFPLPENAAVRGMTLRSGDREITAKIDERQRARASFHAAKKEGLLAALLEQERANVFVYSITNVAPGKAIEVTTRYIQDLTYDAGVYEVVFPMVVGPRSGTGASRITPPYLGKGERSGVDVAIDVIAERSVAPRGFVGVTHSLSSRETSDGKLRATLANKDKVANRDFVLRFATAEDRPRATLVTSTATGDAGAGYFTLTVEPPLVDVEGAVGRRELVFVVDVSGSMAGPPLALAKRAIRLALERLRPVDTFDVITFSNGTGRLFDAPRPADAAAIQRALAFVEDMEADGGTFVVDAVREALTPPVESARRRDVVFITDGFVSADDLIVRETRKLVEARGQGAKVFGVGVGSAPNRALVESIGREGRGAALYLSNREDPARMVGRLFRFIDLPILRDVRVDWRGLEVTDVSPAAEGDLLASRPLVIHGKLAGRAASPPVLHAESPSGPVEIPIVTVAADGPVRDGVGALWARSRIADLEADLASGDQAARLAITRLGLEFGLVTRFTSFVAFDRAARASDGRPEVIQQPVEAPEGMEGGFRTPRGDTDKDGLHEERPAKGSVQMGGAAPAAPPEEADRGPRGCFCRAGGADGAGAPYAWLVALTLTLLWRRQRR